MNTLSKKTAIALAVMTIFFAAAVGADDEPALRLQDSAVLLPTAEDGFVRRLVIVYRNPEKDDSAEPKDELTPTISVLGDLPDASWNVVFGDVEKQGTVGNNSYWLVDMTVSGLKPEATATLPLWLSIGDEAANTVNLAVEWSKKEPNLEWTLSSPAKVLVHNKNRFTDFVASTGAKPVLGLHVLSSTLQEEATQKRIGAESLQVCETVAKCGAADVPMQSTQALFLKVGEFSGAGKFKGNVTLGPANGKASKHFELTVYSRPPMRVVLGWTAILAGLVVAFGINILAKNSLARLRALVPIARLVERSAAIRQQIADLAERRHTPLPQLTGRLATIDGLLTPGYLTGEGYLPRRLADPFGEDPAWAANLKAHADKQAGKLAIVDVLVQEGLKVLDADWRDADKSKYVAAFKAIDKLAESADIATARAGIAKAIGATLPTQTVQMLSNIAPRKLDVETLNFDITAISSAVWVVWLLVTLAAGAYILIYSNLGFGTALDLFKCFFWGVGFGVGGQTLQQLTPAATAKQFSIAFPKTQ